MPGNRAARVGAWALNLPYVVFGLALVVDLAARPDHRAHSVILALVFVIAELIGVAFGVRAAFHSGLDAAERRPWRYLTAWFVLQIFYGASSAAAMHQGTFESDHPMGPARVATLACRLLELPILFRGLLAFAGEPLTPWGRRKLAMDVATVFGAAVMVIWYFLIGPGLFDPSRSTDGGLRVFIIAFPLCDLVLLVAVLTVQLRGVGASARRPVALLTAGLTLELASDVYLTYLAVLAPGRQIQVVWEGVTIVGVMLIDAAAIERCRLTGDRRRGPQVFQRLRPYAFLPYLALAGGYLMLIVLAVRAGAYPWPGLVGGAVVMTAAVAFRQLISLRENHLLAVTDGLTGLANRLLLHDRMGRALERARRSEAPMALLLIDLDGFKKINDTYGHEAGDAVLIDFARTLERHVRSTDTAARLGGDEFAVLLDGVTDAQDAVEVAHRLLADMATAPGARGNPALRVGASIGISVGEPRDRGGLADPHKQLRQADQAMYVAKKAKTTGWCLYTRELDEAVEHAVHEIETPAAGLPWPRDEPVPAAPQVQSET